MLPKGDGTPPKKTTAKLSQATIDKLSALEYEGFKKTIRTSTDHSVDLRYHTKERPRLSVDVTVAACFDCLAMDLPQWQAKDRALKVGLASDDLFKRSDTVFELGQTDLHGAPVIFAYLLGHAFQNDETGQPSGDYAHAYTLYFNDGINQIRVAAKYSDDPLTREKMVEMAPRADLEKIAKAYLDAFTHAW
ncbi:MAG: hypothetical protein AB7P03_02345 [Kofleriaceae bacterium]